MTVAAPRPDHDAKWCDVNGSHIPLFSWVKQVAEDPEPGVLFSRLHQQAQVVGRGLDSLYVCFSDDQVVSLRPRLLRLLPDVPGQC